MKKLTTAASLKEPRTKDAPTATNKVLHFKIKRQMAAEQRAEASS
jgi:hypothetical protein